MIADPAERIPQPVMVRLVRVAEAAEMAGVSPRVMYDWVASGVIPTAAIVRVGRAVYVRQAQLLEWLHGGNGNGAMRPEGDR